MLAAFAYFWIVGIVACIVWAGLSIAVQNDVNTHYNMVDVFWEIMSSNTESAAKQSLKASSDSSFSGMVIPSKIVTSSQSYESNLDSQLETTPSPKSSSENENSVTLSPEIVDENISTQTKHRKYMWWSVAGALLRRYIAMLLVLFTVQVREVHNYEVCLHHYAYIVCYI